MPGSADGAIPVRVLLFASLKEAAGWGERWVRTDPSLATPLALWRQLGLASLVPLDTAAPPAADGLPAGVQVAINQEFASPQAPLAEGDELAFLPPITGG